MQYRHVAPTSAASPIHILSLTPWHIIPNKPHSLRGFLFFVLLLCATLSTYSFADSAQTTPSNPNQNNATDNVIYFGLLPYLSTAALMKTWQPFADFIAETLQKKVMIKTAPNFKTFVERTAAGRYHVLMTAPHFAALAVKNSGYRVIAGHSNELSGDIIVSKNARFQSIGDLRGKIFATPDPLAVVSMLAELTLKRNGLTPNQDISIKVTASHNAALIDVAEGRAAAAVAVGGLYRRLNANNQFAELRKLSATDKIPHVMYIVHSSLPTEDAAKLQTALTGTELSALGKIAIEKIKNNFNAGDIDIVNSRKLNQLNPILPVLKKRLSKNE